MMRPLAWIVGLYAALAAVGLGWMRWRGDVLPDALLSTRFSPAVAALIGASAGAAAVVLSDLGLDRFRWAERLRGSAEELLAPVTRLRVVTVALASGLGEEILFRGAVLPSFGVVASSVVFGLLHGGRGMLGWTLFAIVAGFVFGGLAVWTGGVLAPAVAHVVINGTQLWRLVGDEPTAPPAV